MKKIDKKITAAIATGRLLFEEEPLPAASGIAAAERFLAACRRGSHIEGKSYSEGEFPLPGRTWKSLNPAEANHAEK